MGIFPCGFLYYIFNEGFLQGISLYVDDMRLLKNICNEFLIYYNRLNTTELDYNNDRKVYSDQQAEIQKIILENAMVNIEEIILDPNIADTSLKEKILIDSNLAFEKRVNLFVAMLPYIEQDEACKYLSALNLHEYVRIFDSHNKPKFEINQQSEIMLDAFKQKGWIFEYVEDENRPGYYKIRRREPRKK